MREPVCSVEVPRSVGETRQERMNPLKYICHGVDRFVSAPHGPTNLYLRKGFWREEFLDEIGGTKCFALPSDHGLKINPPSQRVTAPFYRCRSSLGMHCLGSFDPENHRPEKSEPNLVARGWLKRKRLAIFSGPFHSRAKMCKARETFARIALAIWHQLPREPKVFPLLHEDRLVGLARERGGCECGRTNGLHNPSCPVLPKGRRFWGLNGKNHGRPIRDKHTNQFVIGRSIEAACFWPT